MRTVLVLVLVLAGCGPLRFPGQGDDVEPPPPPPPTHVDLILVVDNSNSMARIQDELRNNLPVAFASGLQSLEAARVAVTTTDIEASGNGVRGNLRDRGGIGAGECSPSWTESDDEAFAGDLIDLVEVGVDGSGEERPLHAAALAICKAQDDAFWDSLQALADDDPVKVICAAVPASERACNAGFRREGAALAVAIFTDEGASSGSSEFLPPPPQLEGCREDNANDPLFGECDCRLEWWVSFFDSFDVQISAVGPTYQAAGDSSPTCNGGTRDYPGPCNNFGSNTCGIDFLQVPACLTGGVFEPVEVRGDDVCEMADFGLVTSRLIAALNSL